MTSPDAAIKDPIDSVLVDWRQGDCVLGENWFVHRSLPGMPLSDEAKTAAAEGADLVETPVAGLVVLTQTCDIVRASAERPFMEVAPLVEVDEQDLRVIERGHRPRYAFIPGVANRQLVADLDRIMTVEKAVVARWVRVPGCESDEAIRHFAHALARKRARFAFPDDFSACVRRLQERLLDKHDRGSMEGEALRSLEEVRVQASPSWHSSKVGLLFLFIRQRDVEGFNGNPWNTFLEKWLELMESGGRYQSIEGVVVALDDLTARDYVESVPLDLDFVTTRPARTPTTPSVT